VESDISAFTGLTYAIAGCGNTSIDNYIAPSKGIVVTPSPVVALAYSTLASATNLTEYIDIRLLVTPINMIQVIAVNGSGDGNSSNIIRGTFRISYRSLISSYLAASASADDVRLAVQNVTQLRHITVNKHSFSSFGWAWRVTFHDDIDRVTALTVDSALLYTTNIDATASVTMLSPQSQDVDPVGFDISLASFSSSEILSFLNFSYPVIGQSSTAYWLNSTVLRIVPLNYTCVSNISQVLGKLQLTSFPAIHTANGLVRSIDLPILT
jgi:hypothetical protein